MTKLNFHQTFPPTLDYLTRLMELCDMQTPLTKEELSELTGIPTGKSSGKVVPHIEYGMYMNLFENISETKGKYQLKLTELGSLIKYEDEGLSEEISQWLLHAMICRKNKGATLWNLVITEIFPLIKSNISIDALEKEVMHKLGKNKEVKMGPFYSCYKSSLESITTFEDDDFEIYKKSNKLNRELTYVYGYVLLNMWEELYPTESELTKNQFEALPFDSIFFISETVHAEIMQLLSSKGFIKINGQLSPYTVVKLMNSNELLDHLYSLIC